MTGDSIIAVGDEAVRTREGAVLGHHRTPHGRRPIEMRVRGDEGAGSERTLRVDLDAANRMR